MTNPVVSLRPRAVEVALGDWVYTIPARPAVDWVEAVLDPDGLAIFPGLTEGDDGEAYEDVITGLARGTMTGQEIAEAARDAVGAAAGRPWWVADRLIRSAMHPDVSAVVHGRLALAGIDLERVSLGAFCDAVYALCIENMGEEAQRREFESDLNRPPAGVDVEELADGAGDDFMALLTSERSAYSEDIPTG